MKQHEFTNNASRGPSAVAEELFVENLKSC